MYLFQMFRLPVQGVICEKANLMSDDETAIVDIDVNNKPRQEDIPSVLSSVDGSYWEPSETEPAPEITVMLEEEKKPITDIIVIGEYEVFYVTLFDESDSPIEKKVSYITCSIVLYICSCCISVMQ